MIKSLLTCLLFCLLACSVRAQSFSPDAVLFGKAPADSNVKVFFQDELPKKEETTFGPPKVTWSNDAPSVSFPTPFGQVYTAQYITHIPYAAFHISVSPSGGVFVTEDIYFMSGDPAPTEPLQRSFYKNLSSLTQHPVQPKITVLSIERDGALMRPKISEDENTLTVDLSEEPDNRGLHHYVLSYTLRDTLLWGKNGNTLFLSLLGPHQPYNIERIGGQISWPAEAEPLDTRFAYGSNNLEAEKAMAWKEEKRHLFFRSNRWLQADVDVRLSMSLSKNGFVQEPIKDRASDAFFDSLWAFVLLVCLVLMTVYYALQIRLSGNTVQSKTYQALIRQKWVYKPAVMRLVLAKSIDRRMFASLMIALATKGIVHIQQKGQTYELTRADTSRRVSLCEKLVLRKLFKNKKTVLLKDVVLPRFIKRQLIPCVHLTYGGQYFLLTKQYILMGVVLVVLGTLLAAISGGSAGAVCGVAACLLFSWGICLHLFFEKSAYRTFLRILYEQYQAYMAGFSEETSEDILLKNVPFAVALDLTSLFPLQAGQLTWLTTTHKTDSLSVLEKDMMQNLLYSKKTG